MNADITLALNDAADWLSTLATDGPDLTIHAHVKAVHEARELSLNPSIEELADVAICLVGVAVHFGWSLADVEAAIRAKVAVNRARTWYQEEDGSWQHVAA